MVEHNEDVKPCPKHGVLEYKVDQTFQKIEVMEKDIKAILASLTSTESHRVQLEAYRDVMNSHSAVLFGSDQQGGISNDVRSLKEDRAFRNKVAGAILAFVAANFVILWAIVRSLVKQIGG